MITCKSGVVLFLFWCEFERSRSMQLDDCTPFKLLDFLRLSRSSFSVNKTAQPPVCEIVDYGVEQYRKKRSEKEKRRRTRKQLTKGVQLKVPRRKLGDCSRSLACRIVLSATMVGITIGIRRFSRRAISCFTKVRSPAHVHAAPNSLHDILRHFQRGYPLI